MQYHKRNKDFLADMDALVYGHTEAKKALIALVNRSKMRHYQKYGALLHKEYLIPTSRVLLLGGSGTGKTHLIDTLADIAEFPLLKIDANKLTPSGAGGGIKEEDLRNMIVKTAEEYQKKNEVSYPSLHGTVDRMVIFIDEMDKLGTSFESSGHWNSHVQSNFLTLIDNHDEFASLSWVFAGAFSDLTAPKEIKNTMGFGNEQSDNTKEITDEDIIKAGLIPEIVGRINCITQLDVFDAEDYYKILKDTIIPKKVIEMSYFGVYDLGFPEDRMRALAEKAAKSGQGVRYLSRELNKEFLDREFYYEETQTQTLGLCHD